MFGRPNTGSGRTIGLLNQNLPERGVAASGHACTVTWGQGEMHARGPEAYRLGGLRDARCGAIHDDLLICMVISAIAESSFLVGWGNDGAG